MGEAEEKELKACREAPAREASRGCWALLLEAGSRGG
jgi:hypothetical protein